MKINTILEICISSFYPLFDMEYLENATEKLPCQIASAACAALQRQAVRCKSICAQRNVILSSISDFDARHRIRLRVDKCLRSREKCIELCETLWRCLACYLPP